MVNHNKEEEPIEIFDHIEERLKDVHEGTEDALLWDGSKVKVDGVTIKDNYEGLGTHSLRVKSEEKGIDFEIKVHGLSGGDPKIEAVKNEENRNEPEYKEISEKDNAICVFPNCENEVDFFNDMICSDCMFEYLIGEPLKDEKHKHEVFKEVEKLKQKLVLESDKMWKLQRKIAKISLNFKEGDNE